MKLRRWQIFTSIFCMIFGTILHFTYDWSNGNIIVGLLSPVNESVWEHLKLLFYPMFFISIIGYFKIGKESHNYWGAQAIGIGMTLMLVVIIFYTYTGIIGQNFLILDISSFMISVLIGEYIKYQVLKMPESFELDKLAFIVLCILLITFIIFTVYPPIIPLFEDPIYGIFGIEPKRID